MVGFRSWFRNSSSIVPPDPGKGPEREILRADPRGEGMGLARGPKSKLPPAEVPGEGEGRVSLFPEGCGSPLCEIRGVLAPELGLEGCGELKLFTRVINLLTSCGFLLRSAVTIAISLKLLVLSLLFRTSSPP